MPDAAVPILRGRAHLVTLPVLAQTHIREPELGPARGQAAMLRQYRRAGVMRPQECTHVNMPGLDHQVPVGHREQHPRAVNPVQAGTLRQDIANIPEVRDQADQVSGATLPGAQCLRARRVPDNQIIHLRADRDPLR